MKFVSLDLGTEFEMGCPILLRIFKISNIRSTFTFCSMVEILQQNKAFLDAAKILKISSGFH